MTLFGEMAEARAASHHKHRISLQVENPPDPQTVRNAKRKTIVLTTTRRRNSKTIKENSWDLVCTLIVCSVGVGLIAVGLESYAYNADAHWNRILKSETCLPDIGDEYFRGKMLDFDTHVLAPDRFRSEMRRTKERLMRASSLELAAIVIITLFMVLQLLLLLAYIQGEGTRKILSMVHMCGTSLIFFCGMLIITSDMTMDERHAEAASSLFDYLTYIKTLYNLKTSTATVGFDDELNMGEYEAVVEQVETMIKIQNMCNLGKAKYGRYGYGFQTRTIFAHGREYTLDQMRSLRFCSSEGVKFAAMIFCLLYSMMCLVVAGFMSWTDCRKNNKDKDVPHIEPQTATLDLSYGPHVADDPGKQYFNFIGSEKSNDTSKPSETPKKRSPKVKITEPDSPKKTENEQLTALEEDADKPTNSSEIPWDDRDFAVAPTPPLPNLGIIGSQLL